MASHPGFFAAALAVGAVVAIGSFIFNKFFQQRNREQRYNNHKSGSRKAPRTQRNLTCPFCGLKVASGDYKLNCGHICHKPCYIQSPEAKRGCTFCEIGTDKKTDDTVVVKDNSPSTSETGVRKRNPTTSEDDVNIDDPNCAYCEIPIGKSKKEKLPCKHFAHIECFTKFGKTMKCPMCMDEQLDNVNIDDTKCAYCDFRIGESKKEELPCKHFAHIGCFTEYEQMMKCPMCMEEELDNKYKN